MVSIFKTTLYIRFVFKSRAELFLEYSYDIIQKILWRSK